MLDNNKLLQLYPNYNSVVGVYLRKDGRKHVILRNTNLPGKSSEGRKTISYPKALIEVKLGRRLADNETVDHIDRDFTNDDPDNLQVLERSKHSSLDAIRRESTFDNCCNCGKQFELSSNQLTSRSKHKPVFCSRTCSGKYGKKVRMNVIEPMQYRRPDVKYYKLDK